MLSGIYIVGSQFYNSKIVCYEAVILNKVYLYYLHHSHFTPKQHVKQKHK